MKKKKISKNLIRPNIHIPIAQYIVLDIVHVHILPRLCCSFRLPLVLVPRCLDRISLPFLSSRPLWPCRFRPHHQCRPSTLFVHFSNRPSRLPLFLSLRVPLDRGGCSRFLETLDGILGQ